MWTSYHTEVSISVYVDKNVRVTVNRVAPRYGQHKACEMHVLARKDYGT